MKIILESERHIGKNPFDFLSKNIIPNGSFVSIGYVNDHDFSFGPRTQKKNIQKNDAQLTAYIEQLPESKFKQALIDFLNSPKYQAAMQSGKSAPFNIEGEVHFIKISRHIVNWRNPESFAKFYADRSDAEQQVRFKHGFGNPEDTYAEDDWRRKYGGVGTRATSKVTGKQGSNPYKPLGNSGFYAHMEKPDKLSLRQIGNPKASGEPIWIFVDADGELTYIDYKVMAWLKFAYSSPKVKEIKDEITQEEQDFLNDLKNIKNYDKSEMTLLLDNILYLAGTTIDDAKQKEPFVWLNDEIISEFHTYIDVKGWNSVIRKCTKYAKEETEEMNEGFKVLFKKSRSLNENKKESLYNKIMNDVSKSVKHHLIMRSKRGIRR